MEEVSFGEWLRRRRKALDLTQEQLAQKISCSASALRKIEAEERRPSEQIVEQLAQVFNIPSNERATFLKFARGNLGAIQIGEVEDAPWRVTNLPEYQREAKARLATFLFTDIEDSTRLWELAPEKMKFARQRHHAILQDAITSNGGEVFQIVGDAFFAVFPTAPTAISAAVNAQRELYRESWDLPFSIRVRMGIHTGEAEPNASPTGGYASNPTMNRVARILKAAYGGQVLLSLSTKALIEDSLSTDIKLRDLGEHHLKNLIHPEHLFQMDIADLPSDFPALKTLNVPRHNLPLQLTSFIGREKEIVDVIRLLEKARLVTLTGPGGTGKTRLSIQVAKEVLDQFPDGVWMVELAPILDPQLIPSTVAMAIGLREEAQRPVLDMLSEYLQQKKMIIILDNCEHLIEGCAELVDTLLHACPDIRIVASSREPLRIAGETSYLVPSLKLPDIQSFPTIESLSQCEASQLFIERALATTQHFMATDENAFSIAQICHRLDGIPLAIELAAGKTRALSAGQIAQRLDDRFQLLTGGSRTSLPRHQTLRATIEWSYNLLSPSEQTLFRHLSVFLKGWTLEAAEAVCSGAGVKSDAIVDLLTQLVNKSMVIVVQYSLSGEPRYHMLETIRQYAHEKLSEARDSEIIRQRHLNYFVTLAEQAKPEFDRSNQSFWFNKFADELDNFRLAIEWALMTDSALGLRIIISADRFWGRQDTREVQRWLAQLLGQYKAGDSLRALALNSYGWILASGGDLAQAQIIAHQSLALSRAISDKYAEAASLGGLGTLIALHGDLERGVPLLEQSLALYRSLGDKLGQANATASLSLNHNDLERSKSLLLQSLKLYRELGNLSQIAYCLSELAQRAIWEGDFSSPVPWLEEARAIHRQHNNQRDEAGVLSVYGSLAYWSGNYKRAVEYFEESKTLYEVNGSFMIDSLWSRVNMAYAILRQGNMEYARDQFKICANGFHRGDSTIGLVYAIEGLASLYVSLGLLERAAELFAWADAMREKINDFRPPLEQNSVERDLAVIHSQLNENEYVKLFTEGRAMSTEEAIAYALDLQ